MTTKKQDLIINQGTDFSTSFPLKDVNGDPLNLVGYSANSLIKKWYTSQNSTPFTVSINTISGSINLSLSANTTTNLSAGRYVYDINLTDTSNNVSRVIEGIITLTPSVTAGIFSTNNTWFANGYTNG